jgi:hypothetical protein
MVMVGDGRPYDLMGVSYSKQSMQIWGEKCRGECGDVVDRYRSACTPHGDPGVFV